MTARARLLLVVLVSAVLHGAAPAEWRTLAEDRRDGPAMDAFLQQLVARNGVTALSVSVVFLSLTGNEHSFSAPLVEYALGRAFSPLEWLEYGATPPLARVMALRGPLLALLAVAAAGVLLWGFTRRARPNQGD